MNPAPSVEQSARLVESCYWAVEWLLATHTAKGLLTPRPWIDHPYGEEQIALLEEELLPAMAVFLARVEAIDRAMEADQELSFNVIRTAEGLDNHLSSANGSISPEPP